MKIAVIWWFDKASWVYDKWRDGLRGAIDIIGKKHKVAWYLDKTMPDPEDNYDFILLWDDSNSEFFEHIGKFSSKKGLCLTTMPQNFDNLRKLDIVFAESQPVYDVLRANGIPVIKAFGTDTDFFKPTKQKKDIEYFYPATFSPWKRQRDIAYLGNKLLCVGTLQPDGIEDYEVCKREGVMIEEGYFPVKHIKDYYDRAENVIIPAVHGSERTVLESMSMNILPTVVHPDVNKKAYSYIREFKDSKFKTPREFILDRYSSKVYAKQLLKGIL